MCTSHAELGIRSARIPLTLGVQSSEAKLQKEHTFGHIKTSAHSGAHHAGHLAKKHQLAFSGFSEHVQGLR
jgi:hypothetical protein